MTHRQPIVAERRRSPIRGAALATALLVAACGGSGGTTSAPTTAPTTTGATAPAVTTTAGTPSSTTVGTPTTSTVDDLGLGAAVAALGTRYRFTATITVGGSETTGVEGLITDGTGHYLVTVGGEQVEYLVGPAGQWARSAGGAWTVLGTAAPVGDPLVALAGPTSITPISGQGPDAVLLATYPATALGFPPGDDVAVTLTIVGGVLVEARYRAPLGAAEAEVVTGFAPDPTATPITVPPG